VGVVEKHEVDALLHATRLACTQSEPEHAAKYNQAPRLAYLLRNYLAWSDWLRTSLDCKRRSLVTRPADRGLMRVMLQLTNFVLRRFRWLSKDHNFDWVTSNLLPTVSSLAIYGWGCSSVQGAEESFSNNLFCRPFFAAVSCVEPTTKSFLSIFR
jgi:hypothetical protein